MTDTVNSQVTDYLTHTNTSILGTTPAQSIGSVYQVTGQSISLNMQNAMSVQNGMQQINTAVISIACRGIVTSQQSNSTTEALARKVDRLPD